MIQDILIPFITIIAAEMGDKTQLSILCLSSETKKQIPLLLGVMLAFVIVDGIAIAAGSWIIQLVPLRTVKIVSAIIFIVIGVFLLIRKEKEETQKKLYSNPFFAGFTLIFLAEWGDKTQIAAALFATNYNAVLVFLGTMSALFVVSVTAVYFGKFIADHIPKNLLNKIVAVAFIVIGIAFFF